MVKINNVEKDKMFPYHIMHKENSREIKYINVKKKKLKTFWKNIWGLSL